MKEEKPPSPEAVPPPAEEEERVPSRASAGSRPASIPKPGSRQQTQESALGMQKFLKSGIYLLILMECKYYKILVVCKLTFNS